MKEIKSTKVIEEILYESEDGKLQSKNKRLVEDYENALKLKGDLKSFEIGRLIECETLSNLFAYGTFKPMIYEVKNKSDFLPLVATIKKKYNFELENNPCCLLPMFDQYANPSFKFMICWKDNGDSADTFEIIPLQDIFQTLNSLQLDIKGVRDSLSTYK